MLHRCHLHLHHSPAEPLQPEPLYPAPEPLLPPTELITEPITEPITLPPEPLLPS